jgi:hypothetical protein
MSHTPACKQCFDRGVAAITQLTDRMKVAFPRFTGNAKETRVNVTIAQEITTYGAIGEISFSQGEWFLTMGFNGVGCGTRSFHIADWDRFKVTISSSGVYDHHFVYEKKGALDYAKIIEIATSRHQAFHERRAAEKLRQDTLATQEDVVQSVKPQLNKIRGCTQVHCGGDGTFTLTINDLDAERLRAVIGALTIHHAE